ncbi:hypothetical protein U1Q18_018072, partial [Sarracenia purpurea var. burkii]
MDALGPSIAALLTVGVSLITLLKSCCMAVAVHYIKEGQYARDLNHTIWMAENYFEAVKPLKDGLDLVLMDVDDFFPSGSPYGDPLQF